MARMATSCSAIVMRAGPKVGCTPWPASATTWESDLGGELTGTGVFPGSLVPALFLSDSIHLGRISIITRAPSFQEGAAGIWTRPRTCVGETFVGTYNHRMHQGRGAQRDYDDSSGRMNYILRVT